MLRPRVPCTSHPFQSVAIPPRRGPAGRLPAPTGHCRRHGSGQSDPLPSPYTPSPNYTYRKVPFTPTQLKVVGELSLDQAQRSPHERTRLERVLREHSDAFTQDESDLGQTLLLEHEIDTQGLPPFKIKFRPIPYKALEWLKTEVERLLKAGLIRPSKSPYSSP